MVDGNSKHGLWLFKLLLLGWLWSWYVWWSTKCICFIRLSIIIENVIVESGVVVESVLLELVIGVFIFVRVL